MLYSMPMESLNDIKPNQKKALFLTKRLLSEFVCDAVNLEGINYTLPEVQTLLDGVTVGGHTMNDQIITLNQAAAWNALFKIIEKGKFELSKTTACNLHAIAGKKEALKWGQFRDGNVTIAGSEFNPPAPDELDACWNTVLEKANTITPVIDRSIYVFLQMARNQFFFDANKRMGRFMMNGILLNEGYPAINLPAKRQLEFNKLMIEFYQSNEISDMTTFMKSCINPQTIKIMAE